MSDEEDLPKTLTPNDANEIIVNSQERGKFPWGRVLSYPKYLPNVDLIEPFSFGRADSCTVRVTRSCCPSNVVFNISKIHFRIEKSEEDNLIYITDLSKNGTFVNGLKLGIRKRKILKDRDVIAVSSASYKIYRFLAQGSQEDDFLPTCLLDKYANVCLLGRGSCGEVRLVKDRYTFGKYAIKKIVLSDSSLIHRINHPAKVFNEISILEKLSHPGVIKMFNIVQYQREVFLVLEYMQGGEFTKRILHHPMSEDVAKFYFLQMILATEYLHSQGVLHRDLKPENILLRDNGEETLLKISDFGLSKLTEESNATTMCGTLRYVAPEVIHHCYRDCGEYGSSADIWSLGVILYFTIARELPFKGEDNRTVANNIVLGNYDLCNEAWMKVSPTLVKLIKKMLEIVPKKRIQICNIIKDDWIKNDHCVKYRVRRLLRNEGLDNPIKEELIEPSPKRFKFNDTVSSSSDESNTTLASVATSSSFPSSTICCT